MTQNFGDPKRTIELLDKLQLHGLTDELFSTLHGGTNETIAKHRKYCEETDRFREGSRNWQVQEKLVKLASLVFGDQVVQLESLPTTKDQPTERCGIYIAFPTTLQLKKTEKKLFCKSKVNNQHTKVGKFEGGAEGCERRYQATFDGEIDFHVLASVSVESIRRAESVVLELLKSSFGTVDNTREWFATDDHVRVAALAKEALEQSGIESVWVDSMFSPEKEGAEFNESPEATEIVEEKAAAEQEESVENEKYPSFYHGLKNLQVQLSPNFEHSLVLRTHRALSWLERAEKECGDDDARFIFLWVAFNALYGREIPDRANTTERQTFRLFLQSLNKSDEKRYLLRLLSNDYRDETASLIQHKFVFQPFWDFQAGRISEARWKDSFAADKERGMVALDIGNAYIVLETTLDRLYTLRNQVLHGNSTWRSSVNRSQIEVGAKLLSHLVPTFIKIVLENPNKDWCEPSYKVVDCGEATCKMRVT